jgi:hypothetical protein
VRTGTPNHRLVSDLVTSCRQVPRNFPETRQHRHDGELPPWNQWRCCPVAERHAARAQAILEADRHSTALCHPGLKLQDPCISCVLSCAWQRRPVNGYASRAACRRVLKWWWKGASRFRHEEAMPPNTAATFIDRAFFVVCQRWHNGAMDQVKESQCVMWSVHQFKCVACSSRYIQQCTMQYTPRVRRVTVGWRRYSSVG